MSIKQNITSLQSLLEQVNALPEAGGSVGTCTVTVNYNSVNNSLSVHATVLDDSGAVKAETIVIPRGKSKEIQCLCGSLFGFEYSMNDNWDNTDNMTELDYNNDCAMYQAPTTPGDTATINIYM